MRDAGAGYLIRQGLRDWRANGDVALPLVLLAAVLHMLLQSLLQPLGPLDPTRPDNVTLLAMLGAAALLACLSLALAILWARTVFLGRAKVMAGGLRAMLRRWGAALGLLGWAALLWLISLLPAMLLAGTLGLMLSLIAGGAPVMVQLLIGIICLTLPGLVIGAALCVGVGEAALDRSATLLHALVTLADNWRPAAGLVMIAALPPLLLAGLVLLLMPAGMVGMAARGGLSAAALASMLLILPPLVRLTASGRDAS